MNDTIVSAVIDKFKQRSRIGIEKYGTTLDRDDLTLLDWIQHAQEEHMDAILYLEKLKKETIMKDERFKHLENLTKEINMKDERIKHLNEIVAKQQDNMTDEYVLASLIITIILSCLILFSLIIMRQAVF